MQKKTIYFDQLDFANTRLSLRPIKALMVAMMIYLSFMNSATAQVVLEKGIVEKEIVDLELSDGKDLFELIRTYNHDRNKVGGILGNRWCFDFEEKLEITVDQIKVLRCGMNTGLIFKKQKESEKLFVLEPAVAFEKSSANSSFEAEVIEIQESGEYLRRLQSTNAEHFIYTKDGVLVERRFAGKKKRAVKIELDSSGKPQSLTYLGRQTLSFKYDANGMLSEILIKEKRIAAYSVIEQRLMSIKNAWGERVIYDYSDIGLLNLVEYQDGNQEKFSYNKKGLVSEHTLVNGCTRQYDYERVEKGRDKGELRLSLKDSCSSEDSLKIAFNDKLLDQKKSKRNGSKDRVSKKKSKKSNDEFARIAVVRDAKGLPIKLISDSTTWEMSYDSETNRLTEIKKIDGKKKHKTFTVRYKKDRPIAISEKGKQKEKRKDIIKYEYSKSGELLRVKAKGKEAEKLALINRFSQLNKIQVADTNL